MPPTQALRHLVAESSRLRRLSSAWLPGGYLLQHQARLSLANPLKNWWVMKDSNLRPAD
ncbi:hypothetical protein WCLP8_1430053 [uncultured Gammaproteobacteria bacterium]